LVKVPYLRETNECLVPYKTNQIIIDVKEEKKIIIDKIINHSLQFSFINKAFNEKFSQINNYEKILNNTETSNNNQIDNLDLELKIQYEN
jgi:hypothetical protein